MNFIPGRMVAPSAKVVIGEKVTFSLNRVPPEEYDKTEVIVGIRPEHLSVNRDGAGAFGFRVSHTEILGADTIVYGSLDDSTELFTVRMPGIHQIERKTVMKVAVDPKDIHLFSREDGRRISLSESARKGVCKN
jgi:sn-glycerol 3-phosphate transport system ATP-binding protein